jgi:uncharacterized protein YfkK (UPF0435 family)
MTKLNNPNSEDLEGNDGLLEEGIDDNTPKIKPNKIEVELSKEKKDICRQIVKEINNFGVSQRQKLFIVELLALEMENREALLVLGEACKTARESLNKSILNPEDKKEKKKLIIGK